MADLFHSSKDGLIRVWDRATLQSVRTLVGHEGPVNAVAFQSSTGRVVSASGDNKMILWDIETGTSSVLGRQVIPTERHQGARLRTFEGHDRCLACIEFKVYSLSLVALPRKLTLRSG